VNTRPEPGAMTDSTTNHHASTIAAVISTRNRGREVVNAIRSILCNDHPSFTLIVVDQSDDDHTEKAIAPFLDDQRFRYIRTNSVGVSTGRNIGIDLAKTDIVAVTDDDCEVAPNWLREMANAFEVDSRIGLVFGNVAAGEFGRTRGFIPTYERAAPYLANSVWEKNRVCGIGACMGIRRSAWESLKGFDEMLGPGAPFMSHEEGDLAIRMLLARYLVYETPEVKVIHNGFRTWKEGRALAVRNYFGIGATFAKYVKLGHGFIWAVIGQQWGYETVGKFLHNVVVKRRLSGATPVVSFCKGFAIGLMQHVDATTGRYYLR
jgi:GT2 family glycosyltransferase